MVSEVLLVDHPWPVVSIIELLVDNEVHSVPKTWYHPKLDSRLLYRHFAGLTEGKGEKFQEGQSPSHILHLPATPLTQDYGSATTPGYSLKFHIS